MTPASVRAKRKEILRHLVEHPEDATGNSRDVEFVVRYNTLFRKPSADRPGGNWIEAFE